MNISLSNPIFVCNVINEIQNRQGQPWNNGRINDFNMFPNLQKLFSLINSGIPKEDYFYSGDLFRLHSSEVGLSSSIDTEKDVIVSKNCSDGSCSFLHRTEYTNTLVSYSKYPDFTDTSVFYKVISTEKAVLIHANTKELYGIDVNAFLQKNGIRTRYEKENEVLFPLNKDYVEKEYWGTPNKFAYYLRRFKQRGGTL